VSVNTTDPMIGRLVDGRYQVRSRIARGGMATVYLATDLRLERRVAIKVMHGHLADDSQFKQRFIQEARSAARLAHPNVVNVFDQGEDDGFAYLVMEYLPGITLRELLQEYGSLTPDQTIDITEAVLAGLAAAHKAGIVHRDLKPENVLLADDGRIKIGDFGLARAATAATATGAALLGTIAYLSPELVTRGVADTRSDIYAVGIMMYEMLTGEQPFKGEQPMQIAYQHANEQVPAPSGKNPRVPAELDELVRWATARDPEERPVDARELLEQLHDTEELLRTALPVETGPTTVGTALRTAAQRTRLLPRAPQPTVATTRLAPLEDETRVLSPRVPTEPVPDSTAALQAVSQRRRRRGGWLLALVLLVAALAGGTGWWFGWGPGAQVAIPDSIVGASPEDAATILTDLELDADPARTTPGFSTEIAAGLVMGSDPEVGTAVQKGVAITLVVSQGPQPLDLPTLIGTDVEAAHAAVQEHWSLQDDVVQFDAEVPKGTVIDALGQIDGEQASLAEVAQYGEQQPITLVVSAGPLPDVAGLSPSDAEQKIRDAGLTPVQGAAEYHDTIPEGNVIGLVTTDASGAAIVFHPGMEIGYTTSRGHAPVAVPDIVKQSWSDAKKMLSDAGLHWAFADDESEFLANNVPFARVSAVKPGVGAEADYGSTVQVTLGVGR